MQKHFRTSLGDSHRFSKGRAVYCEALNPYFGYLYTIKRTLARGKTPYQDLRLVDTDEFGKVLLLDNITQVAEKNEYQYHEPMVHPALCSHPNPESVLVIGGGDGGIIREVLKYPCVKKVTLCEIDKGVIDFSKKHLSMIHGGAFNDSRLQIVIGEGRTFVSENKGAFDSVIMDMTDPAGPSMLLYTKEFFKLVKRSFKDDRGMFVMHSESPVSRPGAFSCIQKTLRSSFAQVTPFYCYIQMYAVLWSITVCSGTINPSRCTAKFIDKKISRNGLGHLRLYSGATHCAMKTPYPYIQEILEYPSRIITDAHPHFPDDFLMPSKSPKGR